MRALFAFCMIVTATFVWASPVRNSHAAAIVRGEVLEVRNVGSYSYLRLKTQDGEIRAAVIKAQVKKGATVTIKNSIVLKNFESRGQKKVFRTILLGTLDGSAGSATGQLTGTARPIPVKMTVTGDIRIPKASGTNALTVAEIITRSAELKDQTVVVRGKVVKYNPEIMGKNWVHLRDGTGSTVDNTNDLLVTTTDEARIGDVVTAKGVVRTDEDFGSGYSYKVLIEEATLHEQQSAAR